MINIVLRPSKFSSLKVCSYFGSNHSPKVTTIMETKNNPEQQKELRGQEQLSLHMSEYAKDFYYIHSKKRRFFSLYNIFSYLPSFVTNNLANLVQEPKVTLQSDQIFLPKISENSVPVYESVGEYGSTLRTINKITVGLPFLAISTAVMPWFSFIAMSLHYFIYFKSSFGKATDRYVIKMQLLPETEELIYQKVTRTGCIRTSRISLTDIEAVDIQTQRTKYASNLIFQRSTKSVFNLRMIFRVKSTGQLLMFDREGVWHEEGLNHELIP